MSQFRLTLKFSWFHVIIFLVGPFFFFFKEEITVSCAVQLWVFVLFLTLSCLLYKQSGSNFTILRLVLWVNMFSSHCRSLSWGQWFIRYTVARGSAFKSATYTSPFWGNALGLCLGLIYVLEPCSFAAFGGIFIVKSAAAVEQWGSLVNEGVSKLVLGFLVLRKCWEAAVVGGHWCSLGVCSLPVNPEDHCSIAVCICRNYVWIFFSLWKCGVFLSFPILTELIYLFSFGHLMADGLIIVIRLSCLPSTSSLLSSDLSKCGIVSQNGRSHLLGSSVTLGHRPGAGPQEEAKMWLWLLCLVVSDAWIPCPGPPQRLAGRGRGGSGSLFSFWLTSSFAHQYG